MDDGQGARHGARWRSRRIRSIRERASRHALDVRVADFIAATFGAVVLQELDDAQLQVMHRLVTLWTLAF